MEHALEVVFAKALAHFGIQFGQAVQHPLFQFGHIGGIDPFRFREVFQVAQQEPHRVAQATVAVGDAFQDLFANAQIQRVIGLRDP